VPELKVRLLLVDDHEVVRAGLRALLAGIEGIEVVGEAGSVAEAVREASRLAPQVILMDLRLPDGSGVDACREILSGAPQTRILFLTSYSDEQAVMSTVLAGAGIRGGQVIGKSTKDGGLPADDAVHVTDFFATMYRALGYSDADAVTDVSGRPHHFVQGRPVAKLFG
jgi:CheY-like chemotaxis protein